MNYPQTDFDYRLWPNTDPAAPPLSVSTAAPPSASTAAPPLDVSIAAKPLDISTAAKPLDISTAALPPDVRQGYALPSTRNRSWGFAPGPGSAPTIWAIGRTEGTAQLVIQSAPARHSLAAHRAAEPQQQLTAQPHRAAKPPQQLTAQPHRAAEPQQQTAQPHRAAQQLAAQPQGKLHDSE